MKPADDRRVTALLGPTNTGKTYLAIERMLGHASGMIGFPLRLLARENYERVCRLKGTRQAALITGEERIVPPGARYFLCTVESMPLDREVEFLGIDEVQLAGDLDRGHVFTDRLLHARGREETMLLGADTIRPVLQRLLPGAEFVSRPRFSKLSYAGVRKLTRLPPRSAVVAFSAEEVYAIAELVRRQRGGTAVVLGALSPRTRNAQVALFEEGDVDYLVATDAIGMGLNLDLDHVAFAGMVKFDGRRPRRLTPAEVGQIAGRAGRHMNDGTFGVTAEAGAFPETLVEAVEEHRFDPLPYLQWRSRDLDFTSPAQLSRSLEAPPPSPLLMRAREADDQLALIALLRDPEIAGLASGPAAVRLLWEVCQIPDFRRSMSEQHNQLLGRIFRHLRQGKRRLPDEFVAKQIAVLDQSEGDIDLLSARLAHIRTWTYIAHRDDWLDDAGAWQARTRAVEDKLSDALHDRLTQRFVDRRTAVLLRRLKGGGALVGAVKSNGEVTVEGEFVGRLQGFRFHADPEASGPDARPLMAAARRALAQEIRRRVLALEGDPDGAFSLESDGRIAWRGTAIARLEAGDHLLRPRCQPLDSEFLDGPLRERLRARLDGWLRRHLRAQLPELWALEEALEARDALTPALRGLVFQLIEALGTVPRARVASQLAALDKPARRTLSLLGLRLGRESLFIPAMMKPRRQVLTSLLRRSRFGQAPPLPAPAEVAFDASPDVGEEELLAIGYRRIDSRKPVAIRADVLERLIGEAHRLARSGRFAAGQRLVSLAGESEERLEAILTSCGFLASREAGVLAFVRRGSGRSARDRKRRPAKKSVSGSTRADSPFAKLGDLKRRK